MSSLVSLHSFIHLFVLFLLFKVGSVIGLERWLSG